MIDSVRLKLPPQHLELVFDVLQHMETVVIMTYDLSLRITGWNEGFMHCSGIPVGSTEATITECLMLETTETLPVLQNGQSCPVRFTFKPPSLSRYLPCRVSGVALGTPGGGVIIGEKVQLSGNQLLNTISSLNNELTNMVRELHKKNAALEKAHQTVSELMNTDPLTGLRNRRFFMGHLVDTISLARRHGLPLSMILADIDHYKAINDRHGHLIGDKVLTVAGKVFRDSVRQEDLVARYGGDEFVFLLPNTPDRETRALAERIRVDLQRAIEGSFGFPVTASFGITQMAREDNQESLLNRADEALYQAKESGRNQTVIRKAPLAL